MKQKDALLADSSNSDPASSTIGAKKQNQIVY